MSERMDPLFHSPRYQSTGLAAAEWLWCWEDGGGSTCALPDGHEGPHEFIPDSEVMVRLHDA